MTQTHTHTHDREDHGAEEGGSTSPSTSDETTRLWAPPRALAQQVQAAAARAQLDEAAAGAHAAQVSCRETSSELQWDAVWCSVVQCVAV